MENAPNSCCALQARGMSETLCCVDMQQRDFVSLVTCAQPFVLACLCLCMSVHVWYVHGCLHVCLCDGESVSCCGNGRNEVAVLLLDCLLLLRS